MAIDSIASSLNNKLRMTGLSSGLDIDGMVTKLMTAERAKLDKLKQKQTLLQWKTDSYRDITSSLKDFYSSYFDVLKPSSNLKSATAFSAFKSTYNGSDTSSYLTMSAGSAATPGNYTISDIVVAKTAKATGGTLAGAINGSHIADVDMPNISSANDNNKITITFNGSTKVITIKEHPLNVADLQSDLQTKINDAFGNNTITVGLTPDATGGQLTFNSSGTNTYSINYAYNAGSGALLGTSLSSGITLDDQNNKFKLTFGTTTQNISLTTRAYANSEDVAAEMQARIDAVPAFAGKMRVLNYNNVLSIRAIDTSGGGASATGTLATADVSSGATVDSSNQSMDVTVNGVTKTITLTNKAYTKNELIVEIQNKVNAAFGANKGMVSMGTDGKTLRFESVDSASTLTVARTENGGLAAAGLVNSNLSNKTDMSTNLFAIRNNFNTPLTVAGGVDDIQFTINGQLFKFDSTKTSLSNIIAAVNSDSNANVFMKYDELNNRMTVESKQTGAATKVQITDNTGNLMAVMGLNNANSVGSDASMTYNDGSGNQVINRATNDFSINGIAFSLKANTAGPITVNVSSDPSKVMDLIKGFVTKYNALVDKIKGKLTEKYDRNYMPLTEDQKSAMKDADVTAWEGKAKAGLLRSDPMLSNILDNMRKAISDPVPGVSVSLSSIGISSSSWQDEGKLFIDEDKLKMAISNNSDQVAKLFANDSQFTYNEGLDDAAKRATRYKESGLAERLSDILQDNIRTTRNNGGQKGLLLEKAGMVGDLSEFNSVLYNEIKDYDTRIDNENDKLAIRQNAYYAKFQAMESAINSMNAQSAWLSQQFGGGS